MYCVNCGVKLADTEKKCPLCQTIVYHPDIVRKEEEHWYPQGKYPVEKGGSRFPLIFISVMFLISILVVLLLDWQHNQAIIWSGFVIGAVLTAYVILVLPVWFKKPNPVILAPCTFGTIGVYLLYINLASGGAWFLSFAFPVVGGIGLIVTAFIALLRYVRRGKLYIFGGTMIALGAFMLLVEFLMNYTFERSHFIGWSLYPLTILVLLGGMLIFLAINHPAREMMERKFFI